MNILAQKSNCSRTQSTTTPVSLKSPNISQIILNHPLDLLRMANHWLFFLLSFHSSDCSIWKCLAEYQHRLFFSVPAAWYNLLRREDRFKIQWRIDIFTRLPRLVRMMKDSGFQDSPLCTVLFLSAWLSLCSTAGEFSFQIWDLIQIYQSKKTIPSQRRKSAVHSEG